MSEQWEYRKALILWVCDLPRSAFLAVFAPTVLAVFGLLPALLTLPFSRKHAWAMIRELGETAWMFLRPPPSPEERRRIWRDWDAAIAELPREHLDLVAHLLRLLLNLQRNQPQGMAAELYALDDSVPRLVARAERRPGADRCDESDGAIAADGTASTAATGQPSVEFPLDGNGRTLGFLRLWGFDAAALSEARVGMLDDLLGWLQDDLVHGRLAPLPPREAVSGARSRP